MEGEENETNDLPEGGDEEGSVESPPVDETKEEESTPGMKQDENGEVYISPSAPLKRFGMREAEEPRPLSSMGKFIQGAPFQATIKTVEQGEFLSILDQKH
jgi:hypothetical protein